MGRRVDMATEVQVPEKAETKRPAWVGMLAALALGGLVGVLAGRVAGAADAAAGPELGASWTAAFFLGVPFAILLVLALHETGHLLFGRLVGFRFFLLVVGPLRVYREDDDVRIGWNRSLALAGGLAGTAPAADGKLDDLPRRMAWMVAGGPLTSLLVGGALLTWTFATGLHSPPAHTVPALAVGGRLLWLTAFASVGIGLVTLVPARTSGFLTDGARLLQILRGGPAADADAAVTTIVAWSMAGIRPAEWDPAIVRKALGAPAGPFRVIALHSAWRHALDRGDATTAAEHRATLLRNLDDAPSAIRGGLALDLAVERALADDVETASRLIDEAGRPGPLVDPHLPPLARAALAAADGRTGEARALVDEADRRLGRAMDPVAQLLDAERIAAVRTKAGEPQVQRGG